MLKKDSVWSYKVPKKIGLASDMFCEGWGRIRLHNNWVWTIGLQKHWVRRGVEMDCIALTATMSRVWPKRIGRNCDWVYIRLSPRVTGYGMNENGLDKDLVWVWVEE